MYPKRHWASEKTSTTSQSRACETEQKNLNQTKTRHKNQGNELGEKKADLSHSWEPGLFRQVRMFLRNALHFTILAAVSQSKYPINWQRKRIHDGHISKNYAEVKSQRIWKARVIVICRFITMAIKISTSPSPSDCTIPLRAGVFLWLTHNKHNPKKTQLSNKNVWSFETWSQMNE